MISLKYAAHVHAWYWHLEGQAWRDLYERYGEDVCHVCRGINLIDCPKCLGGGGR